MLKCFYVNDILHAFTTFKCKCLLDLMFDDQLITKYNTLNVGKSLFKVLCV